MEKSKPSYDVMELVSAEVVTEEQKRLLNIFSRVEQGEAVAVTRNGQPIAYFMPGFDGVPVKPRPPQTPEDLEREKREFAFWLDRKPRK